MMGRDRFDEVLNNVRNFLRIRKEIGIKPRVIIQLFTESKVGDSNLPQLKSFFPQDLIDKKVVFQYQPIYNKPSVKENNRTLYVSQSNQMRHPCWSMYTIVYIDIEGFVYPCTIGNDSYRKNSSLNIGNVREKDLIEIFNDTIIKVARLRSESGKIPFSECIDCNIWSIMTNVFKYNTKKKLWKKNILKETLIKMKNATSSLISLCPITLQNAFRKIYSKLLVSHNRKIYK
jgi:radical SAM protein with 4Fe4S-binding SPASM domain